MKTDLLSTIEFTFRPISAPSEECVRVDYSELELEVVDHLGQLVEALRAGEIGFEWFAALSQHELARVGWDASR